MVFWPIDRMVRVSMRTYVDDVPSHHVKIGFKEHATHTVGVVVKKERRRAGMDSGFARHWDDKYWFDHLTLRRTMAS